VAQGNIAWENGRGATPSKVGCPINEGLATRKRTVNGIQPVNPCRYRGLQVEFINLHLLGALAPHLLGAPDERQRSQALTFILRRRRKAMAFVPSATEVQTTLEGVVDNCQTINDLFFSLPGGYILSDIQSLNTNLTSWFQLSIAPLLSENWSSVAVHSRALNVPNGFVVDQGAAAVGGVANEAAPNNVAGCISFRTGIAGRSFRGRNYVPGVPNNLITLNTMDSAFMLDVLSAYNLLLPGGGALPGGWIWGVLSRFSGIDALGHPIPRAAGVFTPIVNTLFVNPKVKSMRSRSPGHGK